MADIPFVAYSNAELARRPSVEAGIHVAHGDCPDQHELLDNATPPGVLLFYRCGERSYLGAIDGALLPGLRVVGDGE